MRHRIPEVAERNGTPAPQKGRVLDIGESCLLGATAEELEFVLVRHGCKLPASEREPIVREFARRSNLFGDPVTPTLFLGDILQHTEVEYVSFDVVSARWAERFDLNHHSLSKAGRNAFDLVLNFGTTEHIMNQFNAYKVMHEACRPGGHLFHQVPSTGYINHGYFSYNALMFEELAQANGYELLDIWFYGPNGEGSVLSNAARYPGILDAKKLRNDVNAFRERPVMNSLINVLCRKVTDAPFRVGLELKTAAAALAGQEEFSSRYIDQPRRPAPKRVPLRQQLRRLAGRTLRKLGLRT